MSTVAAPCAGDVAVTWVEELTVKLVAPAVPKLAELAPLKPVPVTVTDVPPDSGPATGLMALTDGLAS